MGSLFRFSVATRTAFIGMFVSAALFGVTAREARADILVSLPSVVDVDPGEWLWIYTVAVDADQRIETGDFFTIYDFLDFVDGSNAQPTGWAFTSSDLGVSPGGGPIPADNPFIPNLTWEYTGSVPIETPGSADVTVGDFSAVSLFDEIDPDTDLPFAVLDHYSTQGTLDSGVPPTDGSKKFTTSFTEVPGNPVPEPGSMLLLGTGLFGAAAMIRRRRAARE
jgi:hypothetical protein